MTTSDALLYGLGGAAIVIVAVAAVRMNRDPRKGSNRALPAGIPQRPTVYIPAPGDDFAMVAHRLNIAPSKAQIVKIALRQGRLPLPQGYIDHGPEKKAMGTLQ